MLRAVFHKDGPRFRCPAFRDSLPHHRVKVRPGEPKRVPRFPGSWTLKSQDRLRPRGQPSRPETVLTLERSPRSREWGIGNYSLFGSPGHFIPEWGTRKREGPSSCPEQGSLRNPEPHRGSGFPVLLRAKWTSFSMSGLQDSLPHHRVKVRPGERKRVPRFPGSWTLKSQDRLRPRGQPSRPETVLALERVKIQGMGDR